MKTLKASQKTARQRGASLIETLIVAGAISSLIALAYVIFSSVMPNSQESKLERQIASLNAAASMYRVSGGYVDPTLSSTQVFAKLKMASNQADADRTVGLSGSMVDPYLKAIALDEEHIDDTSIPRVVWHPGAHRFMLSYEPVAGIKAFELQTKDAHEMTVAKESRNRGGAVNYASVDDWVWDYDEILITYTGPGHIGHVGDGYGGPGAPPVRDGGQLYPPLISVPDGTYPITDFNIQVTLANPNPADSSDIYYSVDRGPVKRYDNEVLSLGPEQFVAAICEPVAEGWSRSTYSVGYYNASPVQLDAPIIRASAPQFDYDTNNTIYVNLDNPNDPAVSEIEYRINGGDWKTYNDRRKRFKEEDYPDGATIEARAIATAEYYLDSDTATRDIGPAVATVLEPPVITFSHTSFSDDVKKIEVIIENPNPEGSSRIYYALTDPEKVRDETEELRYKKYKDEFDEKRKNWPHGFAVIAYCQARHAQYQDSLPTEAETGNVDAPEPPTPEEPTGLAGGHFDLDTSSFIAEFHRGTTDAHVHEYDKKYDVPGADFFDLQGGKLHNITEDVSNGAKFKLIIINPDLSPGGRLVINDTYDDTQPATWIPVQEYANIPLEDLPVFSFTGAAGTTPLTQLGLYFDVNAIADGEIVPTNTGDVRKNVPGKYGEWRNGALTIQAVRVNGNGSLAFTTSLAVTSGGLHGGRRGIGRG